MRIMEKVIEIDSLEILLYEDFEKNGLKNWEPAAGSWAVEDGWLTGLIRENSGGMIYSKESYPGDIMLDFKGRTVPPCANDLNFAWNTMGWDHERNDAGIGYIGGIQGWWEGKVGIENYPLCAMRAATPLFKLEAGRTYHVQAGSIKGHCFIFIDGELIIEAFDPNPIDSYKYARIGFGTFCSHIQIKDPKVYKLSWKSVEGVYKPEF